MSIVNYHPFFYNTLKKAINLFNKLNMNVPQSAKKHEAGINLSILGLCTVAFLGMTLRTKMLFNIPFINYNYLSDAHAHFAFNGWVTLGLIVLMIRHILPAEFQKKAIYWWLTGSIFFFSWVLLFTYAAEGNGHFSTIFSTLLIFATYIFTWVFIRDAFKAKVNKIVLLLSVGALLSLVLSSGGAFMIAYLFSVQSLNGILYRDALFTYLHFQYNGFFPLAIFALFLNYVNGKDISVNALQNMRKLAISLPVTVIPTLFLSYLWHYPNIYVRSVAFVGCICLYIFLFQLFIFLRSTWMILKQMSRYAKVLGILTVIAVTIKIILQTGTVIPYVGIIVFGNRPIIIGYIHLVMLGFITLYLLSHLLREDLLDSNRAFTRIGIVVFSSGVIINELLLMSQGLTQIFMQFYPIFMWLLWGTMIWLLLGAILIFIARIREIVQAKKQA